MESAPTGHPAIHALPGGETAYAVPQSILQSIPKLMPLTGPGNSFAVPQSIPTGHPVMPVSYTHLDAGEAQYEGIDDPELIEAIYQLFRKRNGL